MKTNNLVVLNGKIAGSQELVPLCSMHLGERIKTKYKIITGSFLNECAYCKKANS
jgi:hypothetical protein